MKALIEELRYAVRVLRRTPGFTLTAITMLAVGIGVNATVFTLSKAVLFSGFPAVEDNDRVVYIASRRSSCCLSYPDFRDWRERSTSFEGMAVVRGISVSLSDTSALPEGRDATEVSADTFKLIGQTPLIGRDFSAVDELPGAPPVAILSYGLWERRYGKDAAILGRVIRINGTPTTVIAVMPDGFAFPQKQDLWLPLVPTPELENRENRNLWFAFGRLAPGATLETARAEMDGVGRRLATDYPSTNREYMPEVRTFNQFFIGPNENVLYLTMWGAVVSVLLIACANLANLMLARAISRAREISVRIALGAHSWRILRQLATESLLLSAVGGFVGWWIAKWAVQAYALMERGPGRAPWRVLDYAMDYESLAYLVVITAVTGIAFGLAPANRLARLDINTTLRDGARGATGVSGKRLSAVLVTTQVALAIVLMTGAGLMIRSYLSIATTEPGVRSENVLTGYIELPASRYANRADRIAFYDSLRDRLAALSTVESASIANAVPTWGARQVSYELADEPVADEQSRPTTSSLIVSPDYFRTLDAAVVVGREFENRDDDSALKVAVVNEVFATRHWPGESALGKRLRVFDRNASGLWVTVVGVVANIVQSDLTRQQADPIVYLPHRQTSPGGMWVLLRTRVPPGTLANDFRREVQAVDADLPVLLGPYTLEQRMAEVYWDNELYAVLFVVFATIALLLAAVGLYAIVSHSVNTRMQEIGIRMAIGANSRHIRSLVFRQGMLPFAMGSVIGLAASFGVTRLLGSMLANVSPTDPLVFVVATAVLALSAALGCWIPARRAMALHPVGVLRPQ